MRPHFHWKNKSLQFAKPAFITFETLHALRNICHLNQIILIHSFVTSLTHWFLQIQSPLSYSELELYWLPVQHRIIFEILTLTYKSLNTDAPQYLKDLLQPYVPPRKLRSSSKKLFSVPKFNLKTYGYGVRLRAFSISAPTLWNQLPNSIRHSATLEAFIIRLKTFLFKQAF